MISFEFRDLHADPPSLSDERDAILGVVAVFELRVGTKLLYSESDFPLVEFARALNVWLKQVLDGGKDFEFESTEAAEQGLVWIRREGEGWRIGSLFQEYPEITAFSFDEIRAAAGDFLNRLTQEAQDKLGLDLARVVEPTA